MSAALSKTCTDLGLQPEFTAHSLRAGWATARFLSGQPVTELLEDGTWSSEKSLRIYLDVVSGYNPMDQPAIARHKDRIEFLQQHFYEMWTTLPAATPTSSKISSMG